MAGGVDDFLRTVLRSGVVERDRLQAALKTLPKDWRDQPQAVADGLIAQKTLTSFQAQKLLAGVTQGLKLGPYLIQTPIGKGGMGTVYLAKDSRNSQAVAIKVVSSKRLKEGERHLARFRREMNLSKKLRHPNVALAKGMGEVHGVHYLALEYIPGVTLHRLVARAGILAPPRAARLFGEVSAALQHAHDQGLIHRDLKPTNIMVTPDDHAKVLDFGLGLIEGETVDDPEVVGGKGYLVGSVEYMAPEQTRDSTQIDGRADLYSLGCTMYFALTGRGPFSYGDNKDKVRAHRHQDAEPIRKRNPDVPEAMASLIHRLMAKDPALRPPSAAAVKQELQAFSEAARPEPSPAESAVVFQLVDEFSLSDAPDTLSEAFDEEEYVDDAPTISRANIRALYGGRSSNTAIWVVGAVIFVAVVGLFAVLVTYLSR